MNFVLDASVTLAWAFEDQGGAAAHGVLARLRSEEAITSSLWPLEVSNGLGTAEQRGKIDPVDSARFTRLLLALPIVVEPLDRRRVFEVTRSLAQRHDLSIYAAHYLELAARFAIPLATLDDELGRAARMENVVLLEA
jgi:predicted nucleic acid-binding protein